MWCCQRLVSQYIGLKCLEITNENDIYLLISSCIDSNDFIYWKWIQLSFDWNSLISSVNVYTLKWWSVLWTSPSQQQRYHFQWFYHTIFNHGDVSRFHNKFYYKRLQKYETWKKKSSKNHFDTNMKYSAFDFYW